MVNNQLYNVQIPDQQEIIMNNILEARRTIYDKLSRNQEPEEEE